MAPRCPPSCKSAKIRIQGERNEIKQLLVFIGFSRVFSEKGVKHSFSFKNGLTSCVVSPYLEHLILTKLSQYVCGINELLLRTAGAAGRG